MAAQEEEQTKLEELKHFREKINRFESELKEMKEIAIVVAELEGQKLSNANKFAEIEQKNALQQEKVVKLEKYQKEQQLNIVALQETVATLREIGLIPQNRWDSTACHGNLALSELDRLIVQHNRDDWEWYSVRAEKRLPGNTYFEVQIVEKGNFSMAAQEEEEQTKLEELKVSFVFDSLSAIVVAELKQQKLSNANKFAEIEQKNALQQEKVVKLEKYQKEQQLSIVALQETVATLREIGLIPQNRWDSTACHGNLALSELDRLIVQHNRDDWEWYSVRAEKRLPGNTYFEVQIVEKAIFRLDLRLNKCHWTINGRRFLSPLGLFWFQQLNMDYFKSDQKTLLERKQQKTDQKALNAPIEQVGNFSMAAQEEEEEQTKLEELKVSFVFDSLSAIVVAELKQQKLSNANKFAEIEQKNALQQEKVVKLEKYQKEQQLSIVALQETVATLREIGLIPQNRWDSTACHGNLALSELDRLIVQHNRDDWGKHYYSVKSGTLSALKSDCREILTSKSKSLRRLYFDWTCDQKNADTFVGYYEGTYGYLSGGNFWGHEFEGCSHLANGVLTSKMDLRLMSATSSAAASIWQLAKLFTR
uniref:Uncharacterized protein n=1 Tax=Globodera rostochiensis TaxID=31243 RepID=A0A914H0Z0_GLORO